MIKQIYQPITPFALDRMYADREGSYREIPGRPGAVGTIFAPHRTGFARYGSARHSMPTRIALAVAALIAMAPAAITLLWPRSPEVGGVARAVELHGAIASFTQSLDKVQVRLAPAATDAERNTRSIIIIRDEQGDELAIRLKGGQTWVSVDLPPALIDAKTLDVSVK